MRHILLSILACLPLLAGAQNTWEMSEQEAKSGRPAVDQKYLVGAVPVVDGRVVFSTTVKAPGRSRAQIYDAIHAFLAKMAKEPNQTEQSRLVIEDKDGGNIVGSYQEWLVFKRTALVLDQTRFFYQVVAQCKDGSADIQLTRIHYLYDEERDPQALKAEEWITDEYGLKKGKDKLSRVTGRFRKKTIDRKDYIFAKIAEVVR